MMSKPETGVMYFQDKGRDHRSKNAGKLQMLEKARKQILFRIFWREYNTDDSLILDF